MKAEVVAQRIPRILRRSAKKFDSLTTVTKREIGIREATEYPKITEWRENVLWTKNTHPIICWKTVAIPHIANTHKTFYDVLCDSKGWVSTGSSENQRVIPYKLT
jgi:hypothetical protein